MNNIMKYFFILCLVSLGLISCATTQTTSGQSYIAKYSNDIKDRQRNKEVGNLEYNKKVENKDVSNGMGMKEKLLQVASVEPTLKFPARIGIARIDHGHLSNIPLDEAEAWKTLQNNLGEDFGELIPINTMIANLVSHDFESSDNKKTQIINKIRLGAARQHIDAVIIYEPYSNLRRKSNLLNIADITIIGALILPSQNIEIEGFASAIFIDVFQAYPYGTVQVTLDKDEYHSTSWNLSYKQRKVSDMTKIKSSIKLISEVENMLIDLREKITSKNQL